MKTAKKSKTKRGRPRKPATVVIRIPKKHAKLFRKIITWLGSDNPLGVIAEPDISLKIFK